MEELCCSSLLKIFNLTRQVEDYIFFFNLPQRELTHLVSLSPRLEHLKATCKALTSQPMPPNFIQESLNHFLDHFKLTCQKLEERHQQLKEGKYISIYFNISPPDTCILISCCCVVVELFENSMNSGSFLAYSGRLWVRLTKSFTSPERIFL